jgi:hypothetical protein
MLKRSALFRLCAAHPELKCKAALRQDDLGRGDIDQFSLFECMIDPRTGEYLSEDYAFCRHWTDLGGEIWLDLTSELTHFGAYAFCGRLEDQLVVKQNDS